MYIINLTQHYATDKQVAAGVKDLNFEKQQQLQRLLTFESKPSQNDLRERAQKIALMADNHCFAMIGGAGYLIGELTRALVGRGIMPLHSFSQRVSSETTLADGMVQKIAYFQHQGFILGADIWSVNNNYMANVFCSAYNAWIESGSDPDTARREADHLTLSLSETFRLTCEKLQ